MRKLLNLFLLSMLFFAVIATAATRIPDDVLTRSFGPKHTFMLKVHGPNPEFIQAGYDFKVRTGAYSLSDELYYKVPVYINLDEAYGTNLYRIYTTAKEHYSVDIILVGPVKQ